MPSPTHPSVVNNTELLSKGVIEALTYTFKYNSGDSNLPMTDGSGGWNMAFLYKTFETARNKEVLVDFVRKRFSPVAQSGNVGDIYGIEVRDNITGKHLFGFSGTEVNAGMGPAVSTIGSDIQLAIGVTWLPGSPYQTIYNGMSSWLGQRLSFLPAGTSPQIVGQSLGGYIARDMAQAFGLPMSDVTLFQAPGEFGLFGQVATLATFGIFNDGNFNYVRSPDIVPFAGLGSRYIYLGGEASTDGLGGALIGAHGMNKVNDELVDLARRSMSLMGLSSFAEFGTSDWLNNYTTYSIAGVDLALMSSGSQTYLVSLSGGNINGFATVSLRDFRSGNLSTPMAQAARDQASGMDARVLPTSNFGAQLGSALGSSVGVMLGGSNPLAQIGAGTLLGAIGSAFGQWLDHDLAGVQMRIGDGLAQSFGQQLQASFQSTGIQVVSSQLTNIAMQAIGVTGFGGQLAGVVVNTAITHGVQLALSRLPGLSGMAPSNFMGAAKGNVAAFFGAKLGSLVVSAQTQAGSILGSLGSTLGQIAARQIFVSMGWMAGPVGAFIGTVLGTLIGNLFGRKKPKIPTANAEVYLNYTTDKFEAGPSVAINGGNLSLVQSMAASAEMTLNGFVNALAGDMPFATSSWSSGLWRNGKLVDVNGGLQTFYGHTGGQLWVKLGAQNAAQQNVTTADDAVSRGVLWSLSGLNVIGGDIFAKRALANSSKENISILLADLQVAEDYAKYRKNYHTINAFIGQNPNSALTAGWIQTFQRAGELKLNDWSKSDFYGGLQGFVTSMGLENFGVHFENVGVYYNGGMRIHLPSVTPEGALSLLPQADSDGRGITITDPSKVGYTRRTTASSGNDFVDLSATTTAGNFVDTGGDDIVVGGSGNDTLSGMAGWDWLNGGLGNDLLDGGDGNDILIGHDGQDRLVGGAGDDYLAGGSGHDRPLSTNGNAGLYGGDGNDTLIGGAGLDGVYGEAGDDILLVDYNDGQSDVLVGGAGSDTFSFERWGVGVNFTMGVASSVAGYFNVLGDLYQSMENVTGTRFNDTIVGDAANNILFGGDGDDVLDGAGGTNNILEGGAGADTLRSTGDATLSYEHSNAGVFIDMTSREAFGGHATGDQWGGMDHLTGSGFADELKGDAGSNRIKGLDGDDWIVATVGSDIYEGGDGLDTADYSQGFVTGTSTSQVWVAEGYWRWDEWAQQDEWIETGGHYEYVTQQGLSITDGVATWRSTTGATGIHSLIAIEHVVGTSGDDYIGMTGGDDYITGGKGNDTLAGGSGSDTYYFNRGDGFDQLVEDNSGSNTLSFSGDVKVGDLGFGWRSHATGVFDIYIQGAGDHIQVNGNVVEEGNNKLKVIDFNGAGQLDVSGIIRFRAGGNGDDVFSGEPGNRSDLLVGHGGNDTIYGAPSNGWESQGNVFIGGSGNDQFNASTGDDQYAFDVGDGQDVIYDTGGDDTLVFGATVTADSVRTEVVNGDLRIFYGGAGDYVTVYGGGTRLNDISTGVTVWNTVEFINAGGTWIDIRKLDINWLNQDYYGGGWAPIVLDLGGDGLDLVGVDQSQIVSRLDSGQVARTGWVGATDGMLAVDRDGDGQINHLSEISFTQDKDGAKTDLEGLRAWDTNGDGKITILDEGWSKLKVWVDRNQNGRSTDGELRTLEQAGITTIDLTGQGTGMTAAMTRDNFVHNTLSFTWSDGRQGTAYDVNLARKLLQEKGLTREQVIAAWGTLGADGELGRLLNDPAAQALLAATLGETALRRPSALVQKGMTRADILSAEPMLEDIDLDVVVPDASSSITLETILANAQFDFSDHDNTYAEEEQRLREKLEAALRGDDYVRTDEGVLGSLFEGEGVRGAFGHAFGRPDIDDGASDAVIGTGLNEAAAGAPLSLADGQAGRPERVLEADLGRSLNDDVQMPEIDQAASLLSAVTDERDVWAPAEFSRASSGAGRQWWRSEVLSPDDLSVAAPVGTFDLSSAIEANAQGAVASQHQQLVQALAAFGPKAGGGSSAIWKRSGEVEDGHLAGSSSDTGRWRFAGPSRIHA